MQSEEEVRIMYDQNDAWTAVMLLDFFFLKAWTEALVVVLHVIIIAGWNLQKVLFNAIKNVI